MIDNKINISFSHIGRDGAFSKTSPMFIGTPVHYAPKYWDSAAATQVKSALQNL
jgi:hypothetical protein